MSHYVLVFSVSLVLVHTTHAAVEPVILRCSAVHIVITTVLVKFNFSMYNLLQSTKHGELLHFTCAPIST